MAENNKGFSIDVKKDVTSRIPLEPVKMPDGINWLHKGLVLGKLVNVSTYTPVYKNGEFAGKETIAIRFEFANHKLSAMEADKFTFVDYKIVNTKDKLGNTQSEELIGKFVSSMWGQIKHIMDAYRGCDNYRDIANISEKDNKKYFTNFPMDADVDTRIKFFNDWFTFIANFINGDGTTLKPIFLTKEGKHIPVWLKLLPEDGSYKTPKYLGQGFIERVIFNGTNPLPATRIAIKRNEVLDIPVKRQPNQPGNPSAQNAAAPAGEEMSDDVKRALGLIS